MSEFNNDMAKVRETMFKLMGDNEEAIELMMDITRESEHPRSAEVLGQLIKQNAEIGEKILKMHKTKNEVEKVDGPAGLPGPDGGTTNNNIFIGSTADLQKMLHDEKVIDVESGD